MGGKCRGLLILALAAFLLVLRPVPAQCATEPWYADLDNHWARPYIQVLHDEGVTDGWILYFNGNPRSYYRPDWESTRAQLAVLLCKVFRLPEFSPPVPSYPDVPTTYEFIENKPGWKWIEGALNGGIAFVPPGSPFLPDSPISRQDAVELLIRALDLYDYAVGLSDQEVQSFLSLFKDKGQVAPDRRHTMACAIKLGIIDGYEDDTLRPAQSMRRSEAATVVYRSCLIRVTATTDVFSPDGDGVDDTVTFFLSHLRNRNIVQWQMEVRDLQGKVVHAFTPYGSEGSPPEVLTWDGKNAAGQMVPAGQYTYQAWVKDKHNNQFFSIKKPLTLIRHSLSGYCAPTKCKDGTPLNVTASTVPGAVSVSAHFANGDVLYLTPSQENTRWTGSKIVGPSLPLGNQPVVIRAEFPYATREITVFFTREKDLWLSPSLDPNPARKGQTVKLLCAASQGINSVTAEVFGQSLHLELNPAGIWAGDVRVPMTVEEGDYPVVFRGTDGEDQLENTIILSVSGSTAASVTYVLTK